MTVVVSAVAGSIGAVCRYLISGWVQRRSGSSWPLGTAAVNVAGALALGMIVGSTGLATTWAGAGAGFMGGFTTFSTWMVESGRLGVVPRPSVRAVINLTAMAALGVACAAIGYGLGAAVA